MKKIILIISYLLTIYGLQAQVKDTTTYKISGGGRTALLNKRYKVDAWLEFVRGSGHVLKFNSSVSFSKAVIMRWTKNAQGIMVSDQQPTTFNKPVQSFLFMLDSPACKGGLQYDILLYVNANDPENEYAWRIHLLKL